MARKAQLQGTSFPFLTKRVPYPWQYAHDALATPTAFDRFHCMFERMSFPVAVSVTLGRTDFPKLFNTLRLQ
jgi:hypothetical protein